MRPTTTTAAADHYRGARNFRQPKVADIEDGAHWLPPPVPPGVMNGAGSCGPGPGGAGRARREPRREASTAAGWDRPARAVRYAHPAARSAAAAPACREGRAAARPAGRRSGYRVWAADRSGCGGDVWTSSGAGKPGPGADSGPNGPGLVEARARQRIARPRQRFRRRGVRTRRSRRRRPVPDDPGCLPAPAAPAAVRRWGTGCRWGRATGTPADPALRQKFSGSMPALLERRVHPRLQDLGGQQVCHHHLEVRPRRRPSDSDAVYLLSVTRMSARSLLRLTSSIGERAQLLEHMVAGSGCR